MAEPTLSLVIATIARPTLARSLASCDGQAWLPGDEIMVVGDGPQPAARALLEQFTTLPGRYLSFPSPTGFWGHHVRNWAMPKARAAYLMALDDDDVLTPGAIDVVRAAIASSPDRPHLFRMEGEPCGGLVWKDQEVRPGNVGTPMFVTPARGPLGRFTPCLIGDHDFIKETVALYPADALVWREEVICHVRPQR